MTERKINTMKNFEGKENVPSLGPERRVTENVLMMFDSMKRVHIVDVVILHLVITRLLSF